MGIFSEKIRDLSERRRLHQEDFDAYKAGWRSWFDLRDNERIDVTPEKIAEKESLIERLGRLIGAYEKRDLE